MAIYKVRSIDWCDSEDDAYEVDAHGPHAAVQEWCSSMDGNSGFVDGYPDNHEVEVIHPDGTRTRHAVSTDWSPDFYVYDKA